MGVTSLEALAGVVQSWASWVALILLIGGVGLGWLFWKTPDRKTRRAYANRSYYVAVVIIMAIGYWKFSTFSPQ